MSLFIYVKNSDIWNKLWVNLHTTKPVEYFSSYMNIQQQYCTCIEEENELDIPFFNTPEIKAYLNRYGIEYRDGYELACEEWDPCRQFVTYLNYVLQMSCVLLHRHAQNPETIGILTNVGLFESKYILPVLEKMDIYVQLDSRYFSFEELVAVAEAGVEIFIEGVSVKGKDKVALLNYMLDWENKNLYLNQAVDAEFFPEDYEKNIFIPYETSYEGYLKEKEKRAIEAWELETYEGKSLANIRVKVNGRNDFDGSYRRYPIHYLYEIDGMWKYVSGISVKYPSMSEIFKNAFFEEPYFESQGDVSVKAATRIFVLVLDCNETCDATKYWEQVAFVASYDKASETIEICAKEKGIYEFHQLLQKAVPL